MTKRGSGFSNIKISFISGSSTTKEKKDICQLLEKGEIDFIIGHSSRNRLIRNLAVDTNGNTLVLFNRVEAHGKPLFELINACGGAADRVL